MRQSTRLIVNAGAMFTRMAFTVGIGLVATRLLLNWLGRVDFGLLLALGATGSLLQFVTIALSTSVQRQLAYEIGRGDLQRLGQVFSTAWFVFLAIGTAMWLVGQALAPAVMYGLTIPEERLSAAWWVYQCSLLNVVLVITASPYQAMVVAHQHLTISALADALSMLMRLAAVLSLLIVPWDRMVSYAAFYLAGYALVRLMLNAYCLWRYEGSWPRLRNFDRGLLKEVLGLAGWTIVGDLSWLLRMQGGVLLLNVFFGPVVNAAYGVATQVASHVVNFAQALRVTVFPAIVGTHAKGNREQTHRLVLITGKYIVLLLALLLVPLLLEAELVLRFWLGDLPPHTVIFTRLVVVWTVANIFTLGHYLALVATGNVGWYTRWTLSVSVLILVVAAIGFSFDCPPWFLPIVTLAGILVLMVIAVRRIGAQIGLPPSRWAREALWPTLAVLVPGIAAAGAIHRSMTEGFWRLTAVTATYALVAAPLVWWVGLGPWERRQFLGVGQRLLSRLQGQPPSEV